MDDPKQALTSIAPYKCFWLFCDVAECPPYGRFRGAKRTSPTNTDLTVQAPLNRFYRFFPALRLSTDGYPRRCNARSIPSSTMSWIFSRSSNAIFRRAS